MGQKKGPWTPEEDFLLTTYIQTHGEGQWRTLPKKAGLQRCGKGCRLRWMNYLRPNVKRGNISKEEEELIIRLHKLLGNRWSLIAGRVPGRTDNEIKNYWNTRLSKKLHCKAVVNKTDYPRNTVSYSDMKQNVFQHANVRDVPKTEIFNTEYADVKMDCMNEKPGFSAEEDLITSSVFNGADFIVYDNHQAQYTDHTVNYQTYMDMSDIFAGKFIYNEMDASSQLNQMYRVEETMFGASPHMLPSINYQKASLPGDLTASQQMYIGNEADSSTALLAQLRHQSSLLSAQAIESSKGYVDSPSIFADQAHLLSTLFDESNDFHRINSQGTGYEEPGKPNAWMEPQSLDQEFLGTCFNQFLDSINGW